MCLASLIGLLLPLRSESGGKIMLTDTAQTSTTQSERATKPGLSVIIPAYNEENGIARVIDQLLAILPGCKVPAYEIIIVNDGSADNTGDAARPYVGDEVRLLEHRTNKGYGAALKTGIRAANYDLICITDADGTYPNERIVDLVAHLLTQDFHMVVGARTGEHVRIPLIRKPAKWFLNKLANFVAGEAIPDLNSGLRVFRRAICLRFFNILPEGFSFTTTITLSMLTNHYFVDYVPINYYARIGNSKIRPIRDTLNFMMLVLRMGLYFDPLKVFLPFSGLLLALALAWGLFSEFVLGRLADTSMMVIVMTSIQVGVIGLLAELINKRAANQYRDD
jgi:glycosyltransferase involved in cell wall biosynthesis